MDKILEDHLENFWNYSSQGAFYDNLVEARTVYFGKTGKIHDDDDDDENRMSNFNNWYLFQYGNVLKNFVNAHSDKLELNTALNNANFSIFEYSGPGLRKRIILKDILHDKKITLSKNHSPPGLIKNDIFIGRHLEFQENLFLLSGVCVLPPEVKSILKKEAKRVRKLESISEEEAFLLKIESYNTKWKRFKHVQPKKIFIFNQ